MNKQQLASKIWESANKMRSKIEANEYKDYILGFMFYKFLSDKEVKWLKENDWTDEYLPDLTEDDAETLDTVRKNVGYFIAYENLFSTWISKGKPPVPKKVKYLNQFELHLLLSDLDLQGKLNWDWMILLIAKTGIRFSEALAITPADFDFSHQMLSINKTWDYKGNGGFLPTKNKSSVRKIQIDWQTVIQFAALVKDVPEDKPIFVFKEHAYNSTVNDVLERHCDRAKIPVISVHGLRHTHASVLLFAGVSIASVARRLGHSSMTTTQKTYLHIIQELENQDIDLVMRSLSGLS